MYASLELNNKHKVYTKEIQLRAIQLKNVRLGWHTTYFQTFDPNICYMEYTKSTNIPKKQWHPSLNVLKFILSILFLTHFMQWYVMLVSIGNAVSRHRGWTGCTAVGGSSVHRTILPRDDQQSAILRGGSRPLYPRGTRSSPLTAQRSGIRGRVQRHYDQLLCFKWVFVKLHKLIFNVLILPYIFFTHAFL